MCYASLMPRILGKYVFQIYPDRSLDEMIARLAEIDAMADVQMTMDAIVDLELEYEALEEAVARLLASNVHYTRH